VLGLVGGGSPVSVAAPGRLTRIVRPASMVQRHIAWALVQVIAAAGLSVAFVVWSQWLSAEPIESAPSSVIASFPHACRAVVVSHGSYSCFSLGTKSSNPIGFAFCTLAFVGLFALFAFISQSGRGIYSLIRSRSHAQQA